MPAVDFEWDSEKAEANLQKHGVDFADAALTLLDEACLTREDDDSVDEVRYVSIGSDPFGRVLVVVWTDRGDSYRLISARKATRRERKAYEAM